MIVLTILALALSLVRAQETCQQTLERRMQAHEIELEMGVDEIAEFRLLLCADNVRRYLEFGAGGSTLLAGAADVVEVHSVESSMAWLARVSRSELWAESTSRIYSYFVDIGPTAAWGYPVKERAEGFNYYSGAVTELLSGTVDLILVDGRFRVACALRSIRLMHEDSLLAFHDYTNRRHYHVVDRFLDKVRCVSTLCVFRRKPVLDVVDLMRQIENYAAVPD